MSTLDGSYYSVINYEQSYVLLCELLRNSEYYQKNPLFYKNTAFQCTKTQIVYLLSGDRPHIEDKLKGCLTYPHLNHIQQVLHDHLLNELRPVLDPDIEILEYQFISSYDVALVLRFLEDDDV